MDLITKQITGIMPYHQDYVAKFHLHAHNIGAGGVHATPSGWGNYPACGMCTTGKLSEKRRAQHWHRCKRAFGTNL